MSPRASPGGRPANSNPSSCHRSANASIQVAALPGISQRVNLACSGAQPADMASPSSARPAGRTVAAQIEQLRAVARTGDIDLVLLGLGSNNSQFTFGGVAAECAGRFVADVHRLLEVWIHFTQLGDRGRAQRACVLRRRLRHRGRGLRSSTAETTAAVRQVLDPLLD